MSKLAYFDLGRESDEESFGARFFPHAGSLMMTLAGTTVAQVLIAPGTGLCRRMRRIAERHRSHVTVIVRGKIYYGPPAPHVADFHVSTLRWALGQSHSIAVWSSLYPDDDSALREWMAASSAFQTLIETTPSRAAEWGQAVALWKKPNAAVRFFGPEGVQ
jgi:hypothetical protein